MSRDQIELSIPDLSTFAKHLRSQLENPPSHVQVLGLLARAAGYQNYQHLVASQGVLTPAQSKDVQKALGYFDDAGRLARWPSKTSIQGLCMWPVWAQIPNRKVFAEREISKRIDTVASLKDAAQIRRTLVERKLLERTIDGSAYSRIEQQVPPQAQALIRRVMARID